MPSISLSAINLLSNEPMVDAELPYIGSCKIKCIDKHQRKQADEIITMLAVHDLDGDRVFDSVTILQSYFSPGDLSILAHSIRHIMQKHSPDFNILTKAEFDSIVAQIKREMELLYMERIKMGFCEKASEFYGALCNVNDVRIWIWELEMERRKRK